MTTGLLVALALAGPAAQDQKAVPAFPARAEAVTLDVVVVDKQGRPVRGLTAADFTVLEDGRPQTVVGFEAADLSAALPEPPSTGGGPVTSNVKATDSRPGRAFVFVLDDLGLDPIQGAVDTKRAIAQWLETKALPSDEVTIVNTSGDVYWSDRVGVGRDDLLAVLASIQGRKTPQPSREAMSEWEAYQIVEFDGRGGAGAVGTSQAESGAGGAAPPGTPSTAHDDGARDRAVPPGSRVQRSGLRGARSGPSGRGRRSHEAAHPGDARHGRAGVGGPLACGADASPSTSSPRASSATRD